MTRARALIVVNDRVALSVARHYGLEDELHQSIAKIYDDHRRAGLIDPSDA